ncbi:hypothetical protein GCM10023155_49930 [Bremerella cremea]
MFVNQSFLSHGLDSLVTFNPISIHSDTQLGELLERLYCTGLHHWPVVNRHHQVLGMVTDRDIIRFFKSHRLANHANQGARDEYRIPVADCMTRPVETISSDGEALEALERLLAHHFHGLPVLNGDSLCGLVTTSDYIREFAYSSHPTRDATVGQVYDDSPTIVDSHMLISDLYEKLTRERLDYVLVTEGECALGVVTARDVSFHLCRQLAHSAFDPNHEDTKRAVDMVKSTSCVRVSADLGHVATILLEQNIRATMVCQRGTEPAGVITEDHILGMLCQQERILNLAANSPASVRSIP